MVLPSIVVIDKVYSPKKSWNFRWKYPLLGFGNISNEDRLSWGLSLTFAVGPILELSAPIFILPLWKSTGLPK